MFSKTHLAEHRLVYTAAIDALGDTGDDAVEQTSPDEAEQVRSVNPDGG